MDQTAIDRAAGILAEARRTGSRPPRLPEGAQPTTAAEAHAIQRATAHRLGEEIVGWKVGSAPDYGLMMGGILGSRMLQSGATIAASQMPMLGMEVEIAFEFVKDLPPRATDYSRAEIEAAVVALAGIEVVDTRFADYDGAPAIDRTADFMSNGGFVVGTRRPDWQAIDLAGLEARLIINGKEIVRQVGGHATKDPLIPAIDLVNALRKEGGIKAGVIVTTGTFTGLNRDARPGDTVRGAFEGFGEAELTVVA